MLKVKLQVAEGDVNVIGEGSIKRSLQEARENDDVKLLYYA